jgi:hypothetical protein
VFFNGRWRIGDDGLQLLILVWICIMVCLIFWIQDLQVISLLLRPALMMSRINANKYIRCDQAVHVTDRLQFFDAVVTPVTLFGAGHRTLQKRDLQTMGYAHLKEQIRPPASVDWARPWHEIFHIWNEKNETIRKHHDLEIWSRKCLGQYWNLGVCIASLPTNRLVRRCPCWCPLGRRGPGNARHHWLTTIITFSRYKPLGNWEDVATQGQSWSQLTDGFVMFCTISG